MTDKIDQAAANDNVENINQVEDDKVKVLDLQQLSEVSGGAEGAGAVESWSTMSRACAQPQPGEWSTMSDGC